MPSTGRQKAKARGSRGMDTMSDFEIIHNLLGNENEYPIERELANTINGSISNNDLESDSHIRTNPSIENQIRNFSN